MQFISGGWTCPDGALLDGVRRNVWARITLASLSVPEPAIVVLMAAGVLGLAAMHRKRRFEEKICWEVLSLSEFDGLTKAERALMGSLGLFADGAGNPRSRISMRCMALGEHYR